MGFDDILGLTGGFGRHQWKLYFLFIIPSACTIFLQVGNVVLTVPPKHRCRSPYENISTYGLNETALKHGYHYDVNTNRYSSCSYLNNSIEMKCDHYIFDNAFGRTLSVEFELICKKSYLISLTNLLTMFGCILGGSILGFASDKWGRKRIFLICAYVYIILGTAILFSLNIWMILVLKTLTGFVVSGMLSAGYVLVLESSEPSKRVLAGTSILVSYIVNTMLIGLFGYISPTWKHLQLIYTSFGLPCLLYYWLVPESARWLISKNNISKAKEIILDIAKENRVVLLSNNLDSLLENVCDTDKGLPKQSTIIEALKYPRLRLRILILLFLNFTLFTSIFGITWNVPKLSGNLYVNVVLMGVVNIPSFLITLIPGQKLGRRLVISLYCFLAAIFLLFPYIRPSDSIFVIFWTFASKVCIGATINLEYALSTEIYPTVLRNSGIGCDSMAGGLGSAVSPFFFYLDVFWKPLPHVLFTILLISSGTLVWLLPETFGKKLPETLEDGEEFGK